MAFPKTVAELQEQGYNFLSTRACDGPNCLRMIQIWTTPAGKRIPLDVDGDRVEAHFATCPDLAKFRRGKR